MMRTLAIIAVFLFVVVSVGRAEGDLPLTDGKARNSYSLGYEFGSNLKGQEVAVDEEVLLAAVREALQGKEPRMKGDEIQDHLKRLRKEVLIRYNLRRKEAAQKNRSAGVTFLEQNKAKDGVRTLESGLQYRVLAEGSGPSPSASDLVKVSYRGTLVDGSVFESSEAGGGPALVRVDETIPAWKEALPLMKVGAKWELFVPAELGYGERQFGKVPPDSTLIYQLELLAKGEAGETAAAE